RLFGVRDSRLYNAQSAGTARSGILPTGSEPPASELTLRLGVVPADNVVQRLEQEGELKDCHHGVIGSAPSSFDGKLRRRCQRAICRLSNLDTTERLGLAVLYRHDLIQESDIRVDDSISAQQPSCGRVARSRVAGRMPPRAVWRE